MIDAAAETGVARSLLGIRGMSATDIRAILSRADMISRDPSVAAESARGHTAATLFFEDSTRTRSSFTLAAQRLGMRVTDLSGSGSSVSKGETLADTARTVAAMDVGTLIVRTKQAGGSIHIAEQLAHHGMANVSVLNAGDGKHEHPTQALLDALTIAQSFDRTDGFEFAGLRVLIAGDISASRVARSNVSCLSALGAEVVVSGPPGMVSGGLEPLGCRVESDFESALSSSDVVMMLRVQAERHGGVASVRAYRATHGLDDRRSRMMKPGAIVMHPGPFNRGVEIDGAVADHDGAARASDRSNDAPTSVILEQVANGVWVRMAAIEWCMGRLGDQSGGRSESER